MGRTELIMLEHAMDSITVAAATTATTAVVAMASPSTSVSSSTTNGSINNNTNITNNSGDDDHVRRRYCHHGEASLTPPPLRPLSSVETDLLAFAEGGLASTADDVVAITSTDTAVGGGESTTHSASPFDERAKQRVTELEAELEEARARAITAEELSRAREEACGE